MIDSQEALERYEGQCRGFIRRLHQRFLEYLGSTEDQVEWVAFADSDEALEAKGYVDATYDRSMIRYDDAVYQFAFKLVLKPSHLVIHVRVKMLDDHFVVRAGEKEHKVSASSDEELNDFVAELYRITLEHIENRYDDFVRGKASSIGFITS